MLGYVIFCGLILSAPQAVLPLKCHVSSNPELFECVAEDQLCAILKGKNKLDIIFSRTTEHLLMPRLK